jgi:hypothetical protein
MVGSGPTVLIRRVRRADRIQRERAATISQHPSEPSRSRTPSAVPSADSTNAGSANGPSSTNRIPSGYSASCRRGTRSASLVFPEPPAR